MVGAVFLVIIGIGHPSRNPRTTTFVTDRGGPTSLMYVDSGTPEPMLHQVQR